MPFFAFKVIPKVKGVTKTKVRDKWVILEKDVEGIITINLDANYFVLTNKNQLLDILESNYKCKGHLVIYSQMLYEKDLSRIIIYRSVDGKCESYPNLPFCVGAIVKGNIIFNNDTATKYFNIKKCIIDNNNHKANNIFREFREHFHLIKDKLIAKINEF